LIRLAERTVFHPVLEFLVVEVISFESSWVGNEVACAYFDHFKSMFHDRFIDNLVKGVCIINLLEVFRKHVIVKGSLLNY
jgi:hypothetical protein